MRISVVGTGYVGLVCGTCLAEIGHHVTCVDVDAAKIAGLNQGRLPIYEPGLAEMVRNNAEHGRLTFTTDAAAAVQDAEVVYIAVGTPEGADGQADLSRVRMVAETIGQHMDGMKLVVIKSTVPVGTHRMVAEAIQGRTQHPFEVVSNPEFLREGQAIGDFMEPDRIVIGTRSAKAAETMEYIYGPIAGPEHPILSMDNASAEMTKYASNAFLATKISFINEVANLCDRLGANVDHVRRGIGSDHRIGYAFLRPGVGYGGSCFPKDVQALIHMGRDCSPMRILESVDAVNDVQKSALAPKITARFGADLSGLQLAVWGLAFKPRTDDMREAPSLVIIDELLAAGARIVAYDPEAMENARGLIGDRIGYAEDAHSALEGADALVIITEWDEFARPDWDALRAHLKQAIIFDGRNLYDPARVRAEGFEYTSMGRP